ncbi:uncharacterized protein [Channa argus]|uniref:uncharacterized protein n=1 Tax=Channa argus TaxID=215402 RepID=UPI002944A03E|nr:hypothetical protein Q8A73_022779 [Channa argus]
MTGISEQDWKQTLASIIEELNESQYNKMLEMLAEIPQSQRTDVIKQKMPQKIIEHYGVSQSITVISDTMEKIPRRDQSVQELLQPFVQKLQQLSNNPKEGNKGTKRKRGTEPEKKKKQPAAGKKKKCDPAKEKKRSTAGMKRKHGTDPEKKKKKPAAGEKKSFFTDKRRNTQSWKKNICDLKSSRQLLETDGVVGKVVQKFGLRTYQTKDNVKNQLFPLVIADATACIKMTAYGKKHYKEITEERCYLFRKMIKDENGVKINTLSKVSETTAIEVPEKIMIEARKLIQPERPVCSIAEIKAFVHEKIVSVEGTIKEIESVKQIKMKKIKGKKTKRQDFQLEDDTGFIRICMWGENTEQSKGLLIGDSVKLLNVKINRYFENISLNSTSFTRLVKVQSTGIRNERIEILGIVKAKRTNTHLEVDLHDRLHTFVVSSKLLAKAFDFKLDADIKKSLLDKMPLSADVQIQGEKIKEITAV